MTNPCVRECPDRNADCHSVCEKYKEFFNEKQKEYARNAVERDINYFVKNYEYKSHQKHKRRR